MLTSIKCLFLQKSLIILRLFKNSVRLYSPSHILIGLVCIFFSQANACFKKPFFTLPSVEINHLYKLETAQCESYGKNNGSSTMEVRAGAPTVINTSPITSVYFPCLSHNYLWGNRNPVTGQLEFLSLCSAHQSFLVAGSCLWLRLSSTASHPVTDIELKSMERLFFFSLLIQKRQMIHEISNKSE